MKLALTGCHFRAGAAELVSAIDLELQAGETVVAVGPNGAGKSTLLRLMSGELEPSAGEALLDGRPVARWSLTELATCLGVLPQQSGLTFPFRVQEVVGLGRIPHASGRIRDREIVAEVLERMDLTAIADRDYTTLSGGEQQRTQIARVMAQIWDQDGGVLLLLDEPTAFLDLAHQHGVLQLAREIAKAGAALFVILHDINLAAQYADRVVLLNDGRIEAEGAPWEVLTADNVRSVFDVSVTIVPHPELDRPLIVTGR